MIIMVMIVTVISIIVAMIRIMATMIYIHSSNDNSTLPTIFARHYSIHVPHTRHDNHQFFLKKKTQKFHFPLNLPNSIPNSPQQPKPLLFSWSLTFLIIIIPSPSLPSPHQNGIPGCDHLTHPRSHGCQVRPHDGHGGKEEELLAEGGFGHHTARSQALQNPKKKWTEFLKGF